MLPTTDAQYDFFTRIWEPEPDEAIEAAEAVPSASGETPPTSEELAGVEEAKEAEVGQGITYQCIQK